jgi:predicted nucleic acid-binding protein
VGLTFKNNDMVFIDTAPFIYFFEKHHRYHQPMRDIFNTIYENDVQIIVSVITYLEIITFPFREKSVQIVSRYRDFFTNSENLSMFPVLLKFQRLLPD